MQYEGSLEIIELIGYSWSLFHMSSTENKKIITGDIHIPQKQIHLYNMINRQQCDICAI